MSEKAGHSGHDPAPEAPEQTASYNLTAATSLSPDMPSAGSGITRRVRSYSVASGSWLGVVAHAGARGLRPPWFQRKRAGVRTFDLTSRSIGSRLSQAGSQCLQVMAEMLAEEKAHGHGFLLLPVMLGLGAVIWFCLPTEPGLWLLAACWLVAVVAAALLRYTPGISRYVTLSTALVLSGMLLAAAESRRHATIMLDQPVTTVVTGIVETREPSGEGRWRYLLSLESTASPKLRRSPQRVTLLSRTRQPAFHIGDRISGRARLSPPSGPALPGLADFAFSSYFDGVGAIGFFYGAPSVVSGPVEAGWWDAAQRTIFGWRSAIASRIRATVAGDPGAFAAAIVTDERRAISRETTEALRLSGLAHIVAISGLNMALAAGIFFVGMRSLLSLLPGVAQAFPVKKIAAVAALAMASGYYLISGFGVSAERAYVMMSIMLVAVFFDRPSISLRNVALSALVILAVSPSEILGPSFQMSFAATIALVAGYSAWSRRQGEEKGNPARQSLMLRSTLAVWHLAAGIFVTSLIGGLSTAIFSIEHFHRMTTYGLVANLAAMPIVSFVVMPFGLVGMLLMPFGLDGPFLKVMGLGLEAVIHVAKVVAGWGGDVVIGRQHPWFLGLATLGFLALVLPRTWLRLLGLPLLLGAVVLSWNTSSLLPPDLMVAEDGSLAALVSGESVASNRARPPNFIYAQWWRALSLPPPVAPKMVATAQQHHSGGISEGIPAAAIPTTAEFRSAASSTETPDKKGANIKGRDPGSETEKKRQPLTRQETNAAREAMRKNISTVEAGLFVCAGRSWCLARSVAGPIIAIVEDARFAGPACDVAQIVVAQRARFPSCYSGAFMVNGEALRRTGSLEIRFNASSEPRDWSIVTAFAGVDRTWMVHRQYDWRRDVFDPTLPAPLQALSLDALQTDGESLSDNDE